MQPVIRNLYAFNDFMFDKIIFFVILIFVGMVYGYCKREQIYNVTHQNLPIKNEIKKESSLQTGSLLILFIFVYFTTNLEDYKEST